MNTHEEIRFERRVIIQEQTAKLGRALRRSEETTVIRAVIAEHVEKLIEEEVEGIAEEMITWFEERCCFGLSDLINLMHPEFTPFLDFYQTEHQEQAKSDIYIALIKPREDEFLKGLRPKLKRALDEQVAETLAGQVTA
jgi:hypothetical protein